MKLKTIFIALPRRSSPSIQGTYMSSGAAPLMFHDMFYSRLFPPSSWTFNCSYSSGGTHMDPCTLSLVRVNVPRTCHMFPLQIQTIYENDNTVIIKDIQQYCCWRSSAALLPVGIPYTLYPYRAERERDPSCSCNIHPVVELLAVGRWVGSSRDETICCLMFSRNRLLTYITF